MKELRTGLAIIGVLSLLMAFAWSAAPAATGELRSHS